MGCDMDDFEDATARLKALAETWAAAGFPPYATDLLALSSGMRDAFGLDLSAEPECLSLERSAVLRIIERDDVRPGIVRRLLFMMSDGGILFLVPDVPIGPDLHGRAVHTTEGDRILADPGLIASEMELLALQRDILEMSRTSDSRTAREIGFFSDAADDMTGRVFTLDGTVRPFGLWKNRFAFLFTAMRAYCRARGLLRDVPASMRPYCDIRSDERGANLLNETGLNGFFTGLDVDPRVSSAEIRSLAEGIIGLEAMGVLPRPPAWADLHLRVRRFSRTDFIGQFNGRLRDVLVNTSRPDVLVHEYGHAMDFFMNKPSTSSSFIPVKTLYSKDVLPGLVSDPNLWYYLSPFEVFARTYEIYVTIRAGPSYILRDITGSRVHPRSEELDLAITDFFDGLIEGHRRVGPSTPESDLSLSKS